MKNSFQGMMKLMKYAYIAPVFTYSNIFAFECYKKLFSHSQQYQEMVKQIKQQYNGSIDQHQKQPLMSISTDKRKQFHPQLQKKLQIYQKWQDKSPAYLSKLALVALPSVMSFKHPIPVFLYIGSFSMLYLINLQNEREILTGKKQKSIFSFLPFKVPSYQKTLNFFSISSGIFFGGFLFVKGVRKLGKIARQNMIKQWKNEKRKFR